MSYGITLHFAATACQGAGIRAIAGGASDHFAFVQGKPTWKPLIGANQAANLTEPFDPVSVIFYPGRQGPRPVGLFFPLQGG